MGPHRPRLVPVPSRRGNTRSQREVKCVSGGRWPRRIPAVRTHEGRLGDDRGRVRDRGVGRRGARMDPGRHELQRIQVRRRVRRSHRRGARGRRPARGRDATERRRRRRRPGSRERHPRCSPRRDPTTAPRGCGTHREPRPPSPPSRTDTATTSCACPSAPTPARWSREAPTGGYASGIATTPPPGTPPPRRVFAPGATPRFDPSTRRYPRRRRTNPATCCP